MAFFRTIGPFAFTSGFGSAKLFSAWGGGFPFWKRAFSPYFATIFFLVIAGFGSDRARNS